MVQSYKSSILRLKPVSLEVIRSNKNVIPHFWSPVISSMTPQVLKALKAVSSLGYPVGVVIKQASDQVSSLTSAHRSLASPPPPYEYLKIFCLLTIKFLNKYQYPSCLFQPLPCIFSHDPPDDWAFRWRGSLDTWQTGFFRPPAGLSQPFRGSWSLYPRPLHKGWILWLAGYWVFGGLRDNSKLVKASYYIGCVCCTKWEGIQFGKTIILPCIKDTVYNVFSRSLMSHIGGL